jgi:hypothetical protein
LGSIGTIRSFKRQGKTQVRWEKEAGSVFKLCAQKESEAEGWGAWIQKY